MASLSILQVLVVDDQLSMRVTITRMLRAIGICGADHTGNAHQAVRMLLMSRVDLVLADWQMEPMSGLELLKQVRADPATQRIPVILISGMATRDQVVLARRYNCSGFIAKTFGADVLARQIRRLFPHLEDRAA
jgi:two-component system chemotaxis response regulator CheY